MRLPTLDDRQRVSDRPGDPAVMSQRWTNLLFLHWEVSPDQIQQTLPAGLTVDLHGGKAYLGLVPFYMRDIRPRFAPALPGVSHFLEMNVRTYVHDRHGNPGVWFYSLDANRSLAVAIARRFFHLPYHRAKMSAHQKNGLIGYRCERLSRPGEPSTFSYRGGKALAGPEPGSLDYFLLERYLLFAHDPKRNRLLSGQVHHRPYPVHTAVVNSFSSDAPRQAGFDLNGKPPTHAAFSPGVDVKVFATKDVD